MEFRDMLIAAVPALVLTFLLRGVLGLSRPAGVKLVESARRAGRVVQGTLVRKTYLRPMGEETNAIHREGRWELTYYLHNTVTGALTDSAVFTTSGNDVRMGGAPAALLPRREAGPGHQ